MLRSSGCLWWPFRSKFGRSFATSVLESQLCHGYGEFIFGFRYLGGGAQCAAGIQGVAADGHPNFSSGITSSKVLPLHGINMNEPFMDEHNDRQFYLRRPLVIWPSCCRKWLRIVQSPLLRPFPERFTMVPSSRVVIVRWQDFGRSSAWKGSQGHQSRVFARGCIDVQVLVLEVFDLT